MTNRFAWWPVSLLGVAVGFTAIIGPLGLDLIVFRLPDAAVTQFIGGEIVSLGVVAPLLILAGWLWRRDHALAPVLAIGPALYTIYTYTTAVAGQEYGRYDGNAERFFLLFCGLVAGGGVVAVAAWFRLGSNPAAVRTAAIHRPLGWVFIVLGLFFALTWLAQIRLVSIDKPPAGYADAPTLFWLIKFLDFGFCIPALIACGIGLQRGNPTARRASLALATFTSCLVGAVFSMSVAMEISDDPEASLVLLIATGCATIVLATMTIRLLRAYLETNVQTNHGMQA